MALRDLVTPLTPLAITPGKGNTQTVLAGSGDSRVSVWQGAVQTWVGSHMSAAHPAPEQGSWALFSLLPSSSFQGLVDTVKAGQQILHS